MLSNSNVSSPTRNRMFWLIVLSFSFHSIYVGSFAPVRPKGVRSPTISVRDTSNFNSLFPKSISFDFSGTLVSNSKKGAISLKDGQETSLTQELIPQRRLLGSQELLMLPRQYGVNKDLKIPSVNHVSCTILNTCPDPNILLEAVQLVMDQHPLLQSYVEGDGEPEGRIDLFQMVRSQTPEPKPLMFVTRTNDNKFSAKDDIVKFVKTSDVKQSWQSAFRRDLDDGSWCNVYQGPLWKLEVHYSDEKDTTCALLLSFNHAISDQSSANRLIDQILRTVVKMENGMTGQNKCLKLKSMPVSVEDSVLGLNQRWKDVTTDGISFNTLRYVMDKAAEGLKDPVILPDDIYHNNKGGVNPLVGAISIISGREAGGKDTTTGKRKTVVEFRTLSESTTTALRNKCHEQGVTVSNALTAAMTLTATDFVGTRRGGRKKRNYKVLQSLDMRRFGAKIDKGKTVSGMAGSHDLMHGPLLDGSGSVIRQKPTTSNLEKFWNLAREGKAQTEIFCGNDSNGPKQAVRVFDFAMTISDLNNLVHLNAQSQETKGRAYSVGVTNIGVYDKQLAFQDFDNSNSDPNSNTLMNQHGKYMIKNVFYAAPHTQSGCLYPMSCMTVNDKLHCTFNPVKPIVDEETNSKFADAFVDLIETVSGTRSQQLEQIDEEPGFSILEHLKEGNMLVLMASLVGLIAVGSHGGAWIDFFRSVGEMKQNIANPADFWPALNFWIFFAAGHPLLPPILWISDVLHASPGPKIADILPISFLAGNVAFLSALALSKTFRNVTNVLAVAAFLTYVGAGLDGKAGLGDFNLALDDPYKGQIVKGCPAYEDVRQPSMNDFDLKKYQGLWYEHKFHDWTQFKEVYDTTLDIRLTPDGLGWVDDFAVKGPAPDSAPLSWDKSPVANGAHYFLFGRIDPNDPPGILREKGFGVEFPNYIVDVQKDSSTGEYTEAIQFQCLERGGVRVFEGINFMSRSPTMTDAELEAMHRRAEVAGMYPYGASPEQMHRVAMRPVDSPVIDNNWQQLWRAIGVDKLLELLTEAIEDGGR